MNFFVAFCGFGPGPCLQFG